MQQLTPAGQNIINDIAARYNLSLDSAIHMLIAVNNGGGSMAQFNVPELGGSGQWMRGGMTMAGGDMFNHGLQATVSNLCNELSNALASTQVFPVIPAGTPGSNQWWPQELGSPFSSGAQNNIRYAIFPQRLAVEKNGEVTVYDTLDHQIGGVSQQQGSDTSLSFSSQYGTIAVSSLPLISGPGISPVPSTNFAQAPSTNFTQAPSTPPTSAPQAHTQENVQTPAPSQAQTNINSQHEIIDLLEKLGKLRDAGVLTQQEFDAKKDELMARI